MSEGATAHLEGEGDVGERLLRVGREVIAEPVRGRVQRLGVFADSTRSW